jgi:hypothetical protein
MNNLSIIQLLSVGFLAVPVGLSLGIGFLIFAFWLMAAMFSHPHTVVFLLVIAFFGLFANK